MRHLQTAFPSELSVICFISYANPLPAAMKWNNGDFVEESLSDVIFCRFGWHELNKALSFLFYKRKILDY